MALKLKKAPDPYKHQVEGKNFINKNGRVLNLSDPGTGKTRMHLDAFAERNTGKKALVLAPLSILEPAWFEDAFKFQPDLTVSIAYAKNRKQAFEVDADIVVTNHDAVKWIKDQLVKNKHFLDDFDTLIVDEANAFKNLIGRGGAQRSKALAAIRHKFKYRELMTGTPMTKSILDIWALAFIVDDGERLGDNFYRFRNQVTTPVQVGPKPEMIEWQEAPGAREMVTMLLQDITIRYQAEDCIDLPPNRIHTLDVELSPKVKAQYQKMLTDSILYLQNNVVNAVNAASRATKLLQICTGAVYDGQGDYEFIHSDRYKLVIQLVKERPWPCLVAFNYRHEREQLVLEAKKEKLSYAIIDGTVNVTERNDIVKRYQKGELDVIFAHPASAGHGLTLTRGKTTIWCSPTMNAEHFLQFNKRIHRSGQTDKTETILIQAKDTREELVYEKLTDKTDRVFDVLSLFKDLYKGAA